MYCEINIVWFAFKHDVRRNRDRKGRVSIRSRRVVRSASQVYIVLSIRQYMSRRCPSGHRFSCGHSPRCWCWAVAIYSSESLTQSLLIAFHWNTTSTLLSRQVIMPPSLQEATLRTAFNLSVCMSVSSVPAHNSSMKSSTKSVLRASFQVTDQHNEDT